MLEHVATKRVEFRRVDGGRTRLIVRRDPAHIWDVDLDDDELTDLVELTVVLQAADDFVSGY